jgi:hypothetical protein
MPKRKDPQAKYFEHTRRQRETLDNFLKSETDYAENLILWYRIKKEEMPADEYRGAAFFLNKEYLKKPGALTLCYLMYLDMMRELPPPVKETAFYLLAYRFKMYAKTLEKGGYGGTGI